MSPAGPLGAESTHPRHEKSLIVKRSIVIAGHKTSISLEEPFWRALKEIAGRRKMGLSELVTSIDSERSQTNLSSAIRLFVLGFYRLELNAIAPARGKSSMPPASSASGT
ncbi:MAG TPA: ribbon-helix-helix domain-containing protein [Xanthobacteraceae bacterium]